MGFGSELQGRSSHEALLQLQDAEIRLLESLRKCVGHRIKCDRDYASSLTHMLTACNKGMESAGTFDSSVFQAWSTMVKETQKMTQAIQQSSDRLYARSLDRLLQLINDKKATRKFYADERQRLEAEFMRIQEDTTRLKKDYEQGLLKCQQEKAKYEDSVSKGKPANKTEEAKNKYVRSTTKVHNLHNEYVSSLREVNIHQKHYLRTLLPTLLDFQQEAQEDMVLQCKGIFEEYAQLIDTSSDNFKESHQNIHQSIEAIRPIAEYDKFLNDKRSEALPFLKFEFDNSLLETYKTNLTADTITVNSLTADELKNRASLHQEKIQQYKDKKEAKQGELKTVEDELGSMPEAEEMSEENQKLYHIQRRRLQILKREVTELHCQEEKYQHLHHILTTAIESVGDEPPTGIDIADGSEASDAGDNHSQSSQGKGSNNKVQKKFDQFKNNILNPFKKAAPAAPPTPPSKDFPEKPGNGSAYQDQVLNTEAAALGALDSYQECDVSADSAAAPNSSQMTLQPGRPLEEEEWFHGVLPREEVQKLLVVNGDYLVRESKNRKTGESQYVLSVYWDGYKHFIIQGAEGNWRFEGVAFPSIQQLMIHQHKAGTPVTSKSQATLMKAIFREEWELNNDDINLGQKIGKGNFGDVFKGTYKPRNMEVAIKTCKETLSDDAKKKFLQEGKILQQYDHPNIVKFVGIAAQRQPVMIVMEFVSGGALLDFLKKKGTLQSANQLVKMCMDASAGMEYLEKRSCIHRDLAARNCLVSEGGTIKISDFGMSREEELYLVSEGHKQIPIKWTAPEALNYGRYTSMCDVWSFGILMWEVFSLGSNPYAGLTNSQAREKVDAGYRMPAPGGTPDAAYALMRQCWEENPNSRPHFNEIHRDLRKIYSQH